MLYLVLLKEVGKAVSRERFKPYQSEDSNPSIITYKKKEGKGKIVKEEKVALGPIKKYRRVSKMVPQ